jgi:hypothetical protein
MAGTCSSTNVRTVKFFCLFLTLIILFTVSSIILPQFIQNAHAADVTLAWDPNSEPDIAGYKIHYGLQSNSYSNVIDVGNYTSCVISDLEVGSTYYFSATAYDTSGLESSHSNEVSTQINNTDTDGDGLSDNDELNIYESDPNNADTDGDGINDGEECIMWEDDWNADFDNDGIINLLDIDSDGDGYSDGLERSLDYDPSDPSNAPSDSSTSTIRTTDGLITLYSFDRKCCSNKLDSRGWPGDYCTNGY